MRKIKAGALLLDVYGTVIQSTASSKDRERQDLFKKREPYLKKTIQRFGLQSALRNASRKKPERALHEMLEEEIALEHGEKMAKGIRFPEVRIERVWGRVLKRLTAFEGSELALGKAVALFFESQHKGVKLFPGCKETLLKLKEKGLLVGIVSNAQFYTEKQLRELFGEPVFSRIFSPKLRFYSFKLGCSKPSPVMFKMALRALNAVGVKPRETVFMGNDMLNDVWAAKKASPSVKTVLFASSAVKWRKRALKDKNVKPDAIIREWPQLLKIVKGE